MQQINETDRTQSEISDSGYVKKHRSHKSAISRMKEEISFKKTKKYNSSCKNCRGLKIILEMINEQLKHDNNSLISDFLEPDSHYDSKSCGRMSKSTIENEDTNDSRNPYTNLCTYKIPRLPIDKINEQYRGDANSRNNATINNAKEVIKILNSTHNSQSFLKNKQMTSMYSQMPLSNKSAFTQPRLLLSSSSVETQKEKQEIDQNTKKALTQLPNGKFQLTINLNDLRKTLKPAKFVRTQPRKLRIAQKLSEIGITPPRKSENVFILDCSTSDFDKENRAVNTMYTSMYDRVKNASKHRKNQTMVISKLHLESEQSSSKKPIYEGFKKFISHKRNMNMEHTQKQRM